jgi:CysZ protein
VFKYVLLIVLSPFLSLLSEKVESRLDGEHFSGKFSVSRALEEMMRGLRLALRNIWRELLFVLILTMLSLIGPLSLITAPLIFLIQSYYAGFGNFDFTLERYYSVRDSVRFVRDARGSAIANGAVFLLLIATVLGVFVAPTWATIAATLEVRRITQSAGTNL